MADSDAVSDSMLTLRWVNTVVIWLSRPTLFSENMIIINSFSIVCSLNRYSRRMSFTGMPAGTIGKTFSSRSTRTSRRNAVGQLFI